MSIFSYSPPYFISFNQLVSEKKKSDIRQMNAGLPLTFNKDKRSSMVSLKPKSINDRDGDRTHSLQRSKY